ncbi:MAG: hypothetical protein R2697_14755 [Ilumatobacteraceae bacterium]
MSFASSDEFPHDGAAVDEWLFAAWRPDGSAGVVSGHRLLGRRSWYWSAVVEDGYPVLHLTEWDVKVRSDPFIVKAPEMWAEHHCVAPFEQWSIGNEVTRGTRRRRRGVRARLRHTRTVVGRPRVVRDGRRHADRRRLRAGRRRPRRRRTPGSSARHLRRGAGPAVAAMGQCDRPPADRCCPRPHRAPRPVRVPRRHGRRLVLTPEGWRSRHR